MSEDPRIRDEDPDAIRAEIERTRGDLSRNVNALGEAVQPSSIAKRQAGKVGQAAGNFKDRVMGAANDARDNVFGGSDDDYYGQDSRRSFGELSGDVRSDVETRASDLKRTAQNRANGNPLAAGLIALGAGWLLGSLIPASDRERQAAEEARDRAQPLLENVQAEAKQVAQEARGNLQPAAQEAADSVKTRAQEGAENVKAEGQTAADDVKTSARGARDNVQAQRDS